MILILPAYNHNFLCKKGGYIYFPASERFLRRTELLVVTGIALCLFGDVLVSGFRGGTRNDDIQDDGKAESAVFNIHFSELFVKL